MKILKKPKTPCVEGLPEPKKKANFDGLIISDFDNGVQAFLWRESADSELNNFIQRRELENCLDWLESRGFSSEVALFVVAYLQRQRGLA